MDFNSIVEAARFGMDFERTRVEMASYNLAIANTAYSSEAEALSAVNELTIRFEQLLGDQGRRDTSGISPVKKVHDPGHPLANADGNIFYPNIDPIREMATMVSAIRSYEANVRAYNTNSEMNAAALSIGGNQ